LTNLLVTKWAGTCALGILLITGGCSSSSKIAEQSPVTTKGDGKGTAPSSAMARKADVALVRFVNATATTKDLGFGDAVPFTGVDADDITPYKELPAERHELKLIAKDSHGGAPLATNSEGLTAGKHYTVIAYTEKNGKAKLDPISDDLTLPAPGQAKVRLINLAPSMEKVDLYAGGKKSPLISGATLASATDFKDVDPSEAELTVRHGISKKNSAPVKDLNLKPGKLYTIVVFEDKHHNVKVKSVEDQFKAAPSANG
jgi:uncharacterized protein (DUF2141 family)